MHSMYPNNMILWICSETHCTPLYRNLTESGNSSFRHLSIRNCTRLLQLYNFVVRCCIICLTVQRSTLTVPNKLHIIVDCQHGSSVFSFWMTQVASKYTMVLQVGMWHSCGKKNTCFTHLHAVSLRP